MSVQYGNIRERGSRFKKLLATSATALLVSLPLAMPPAQALPTGPGIQDGHNITVFHHLDFIAVFGYEVGEQLTIDVYRGDHKIGTASGPAVDTGATEEGLLGDGGLEVNHGPEGTPVDGDCWTGHTPDVLPGDRVVVTSAGGTEEVTVDDITMEAPKDDTSTADPSDVVVEGRASDANGAISLDRLDSGEIRVGSRFRANPNEVVRIPGTQDGYRAVYKAPYVIERNRDNVDPKQAILDGDHAMGYGHIAPLPAETQLVDGLGGGGPAPGCEAAPKQANAVANSDDDFVNIVSDTLNLSGTAMEDVSGVNVTLSDGDAATTDPTVEATDLSAGPGEKTWSVQFSRAQLDALGDGTLTATGAYALSGGGTTTGATLEFQKDTVAPGDATADPAGGVYNTSQSVSLSAEEGATIRYRVGGADPTATFGTVYDGRQIQVTSSQTIKAIVVDAAGNPSGVASFAYEITNRTQTSTSLKVSSKDLKLGKSRAVSVSVGPDDQAGSRIAVTIDRPGALSTITKRGALDDASRYGFSYKPTARGVYKVSASFAGDADALGSDSAVKSFKVVRR